MKQSYLFLVLMVGFSTAHARQITAPEYPKDSTDFPPVLQMTYIRGGIGISKIKEVPNSFEWYNQKVPDRLMQYNIGAGMDLPYFFMWGIILRLEAEYSHSAILEGEGLDYKIGNHYKQVSWGPQIPCSTCVLGYRQEPEMMPVFSIPMTYRRTFQKQIGVLRWGAAILWPFSFSSLKNISLYIGIGMTFTNALYYRSNFRDIYPEETIITVNGKKGIDDEYLLMPLRIGLAKRRFWVEAQYIKDEVNEYQYGAFNRGTVTLSCGYYLK